MSYVPSGWSGGSSFDNEPPRQPPRFGGVSRDRLIVGAVLAVILFFVIREGRINLAYLLLMLVVLVPSIVLHEVSHGWLAHRFGDRTAKNAGRLSLNPLRHVDPLGTVIIPLALALLSAPIIGYAKPVPVNTTGMSRNKSMFVALVGPFVNVLLSLLAIGLIVLAVNSFDGGNGLLINPNGLGFSDFGSLSAGEWIAMLGILFGVLNVSLAVFNMLPIPPLDGSSLIERFLPEKWMPKYYVFRRYSMIVLLILFLAGSNILNPLFDFFIGAWVDLLGSVLF